MKIYEKQNDHVLFGGLNLLPPGDLTGPPQALELDNFRPWGEGSIRSRQGRGVDLATVGGASITSIIKSETLTATWWVGGGGTLAGVGGGVSFLGFGTAEPIFMVSYQGFIWATTRAKQAKITGTSEARWCPAAPVGTTVERVSGGGPLKPGVTYTYYVTFVTAAGHESDGQSVKFVPKDLSNPADPEAGTQIVRLHLPTSTDPQVTGVNVYRLGNTLNAAYLMTPDPVNAGSVYEDGGGDIAGGLQQSDTSLLRLGIQYEPDHQDPPAARGVAGPYFGKLLMWSSAAHPNRLWWSGTQKPYTFPGANLDTGNWVDVGDEGEDILDVSLFPRMAIIYKSNSIWRLAGDPDESNADVEQVVGGISMAALKARARAGHADYIMAGEGVYRFNGDGAAKVSGALDPIFKGESADTPYCLQGMAADRKTACMAHRNGRLYFSYPEGFSAVNNRTLVLDIVSGRWVSDSRGFSALYDEGPSGGLLAANTALFDLEDGTSDNLTPIHVAWHSGYRDQGAPENQKTYADVLVDIDTGGAALVLSVLYDQGQRNEAVATINTSGRGQLVYPLGPAPDKLGEKARNIAVRIEGNAGSTPVTIYGTTIHYYLEPRVSKTFDTDESDWGTPYPKEIDLFEFDYEFAGTGTIRLNVFTDASGSMASAFTFDLPVTTGRRKIEIPVKPAILGRLVRVTLSSANGFLLHQGRARYRPIGVLFDGANGEWWYTQDLGIGI